MDEMKDDALMNKGEEKTKETKQHELFTKPVRDRMVEYIEIDVNEFDFGGYVVVRREFFSKANCPAITVKYGLINFNVRAIRKLDECSHIQILINIQKKSMIVKPCDEDEKDSLQWSRIDKHGKVIPRTIRGQHFTAQLYKDMNWNINGTMKMLGTMRKCKDEKIFVFNLIDAEAYVSISEPSADDPKRRKRVPLMPEHWQERYGQSYEESRIPLIETFEGMPEGFVKITLPHIPMKKSAGEKDVKTPDVLDNINLLNFNEPNNITKKEATEDGTA